MEQGAYDGRVARLHARRLAKRLRGYGENLLLSSTRKACPAAITKPEGKSAPPC